MLAREFLIGRFFIGLGDARDRWHVYSSLAGHEDWTEATDRDRWG